METRANYVLIGAFALAGFLGILAFFLWFANVQLDRQFAYYEIDFETVSGLSDASDVRFAGLPVGQVVDVRLSPNRDGRVRVRVEIAADTPVREDSVATIEAQGVTGVSFVGISPGTPSAPLRTAASSASDDTFPMITPGQSVLQSLSRDAPEILAETLEVLRELRQLLGGENQARIETILQNAERSSASFARALDDFSAVSSTVSTFAEGIDRFNSTLETLNTDASGVLVAAETTLATIDTLTVDAKRVLAEGSETLAQMTTTLKGADRYVTEELGPATQQFNASVSEIERRLAGLSENASGLVATYSDVGEAARERLTEAKETLDATIAVIAQIDQAMNSVEVAAQQFDGLLTAGAEPLIVELREATAEATRVIATINNAAGTELPAILSEIRGAVETASATISQVGDDLSSASGRVDALSLSAGDTLEAARTTFANANDTLSAINVALETGGRALTAAESAFQGADRVMNEDFREITQTLRSTLAELEKTVGQVAAEIPGVTEELRAASRSAETAFTQFAGAIDQSAPAFREFATTALPQYGRLATETRALIENLDALVEQIRRNPSRFFLNPRAPEYRR